MASIPLAIRPPENIDPLQQYARAQGVVGMIQQQRLQQQQIAQNQLALNDQKAGSDAMHEWDGKDIDDLPGLYIKHGASANAVLSLKNSIIDQQTKRATLDADTLKNLTTRHDNRAGAMNNAVITNADGSLNSDATSQAVEALGRNEDFRSNLSRDEAAQLPERTEYFKTLAQTNPVQFQREWKIATNEETANSLLNKGALDQATANKTNLENQTTQQKLADFTAWSAKPENAGKPLAAYEAEQAGNKAQAEETGKLTAQQNATGTGGIPLTKEMQDAKYLAIGMKKARGVPLTEDEKDFAQSYRDKAMLVGTANFNLNQGGFANAPNIPAGTTGQDALSKMDPKMAAMVKMVGEYHQKSSEITQRMPPSAKANFLSALNAAYPNYDENEFPARNKMITSFTSGPESKSINAINTAMGHVGVLNDSVDALNNGNIKALNAIANRFGLETGSTAAATFKTIVHRVGPELAAAYIQGGGGEGERGTTAADFADSLPPQTLKGNASITATLLRSKIGSLEHQWTTTMKPGTPDQQFQARFITPEAQATLDKLSPKGQGAASAGFTRIKASDGSIHDIPTDKIDLAKKRDPGLTVQ